MGCVDYKVIRRAKRNRFARRCCYLVTPQQAANREPGFNKLTPNNNPQTTTMPALPQTTTRRDDKARAELYAAEARFDLEVQRQMNADYQRRIARFYADHPHHLSNRQPQWERPGLPGRFWCGMGVVCVMYLVAGYGLVWLLGKR